MPDVVEYWADSGLMVERDFTESELQDLEIMTSSHEQSLEIEAAKEAAKASALAKLEALGLTTEEAQAIAGI